MKQIVNYIKEGLKVNSKSKIKDITYNYFPETGFELQKIAYKCIDERGNEADLNDIDTSKVTDMSGLFMNRRFNGNISMWNVSNVKKMVSMFLNSNFNGDISEWNVSNVEDMEYMFYKSKFNGNISDWNISNVKKMYKMFEGCPLEKNPPKWYKK